MGSDRENLQRSPPYLPSRLQPDLARGVMFPDRSRPRDPRMAVIRSRLSHSASLLTPPRSYPHHGENVFAGTAPPFTSEHSGSTVRSAVQSPASYRERIDIFQPYHRSRSASLPRRSRNMKKKAKIWEHQFVCLASKTQCSPPGPIDRGHLIQAGLGGKTLETSDAEMFHEDAFPKLRTGGEYELLRTNERNTRSLDVIPPPPSGYAVEYLKSVAGQAKIYIRLRGDRGGRVTDQLQNTPTNAEPVTDHYKGIWIWHLIKGREQ